MDKNYELKWELLKEFADTDDPKTIGFCREAYRFLTEQDKVEGVTTSATTICRRGENLQEQ